MLPFLFPHSALETPTYFVMMMLAFLASILLGTRRARLFQISPVRAVDLGLITFVSGFIGARLFHVLFEAPAYYVENPIRVFYIWQGGFVLYGGLIMGVLSAVSFLKHFKEPLSVWFDAAAPCVLLGVAVGRIGCLSAGCCYGSETTWPWGMIFSNPRSAAPLNIPLHPTQLIEIVFCGLAAWALHLWIRKPFKLPGLGLVIATTLYATFRFVIEYLRGDADRGVYLNGSLSTSQIVSLIVLGFCVVYTGYWKWRMRPGYRSF